MQERADCAKRIAGEEENEGEDDEEEEFEEDEVVAVGEFREDMQDTILRGWKGSCCKMGV